ncbi:MAG: FixH family protein [Limisphaerales bacterium]
MKSPSNAAASTPPTSSRPAKTEPRATHPRPRFNPWPASILATFVVFIGGTVGLVVLATQNRNVLVADDYYEQEIRYQERMNQLERAAPFRDEITATHDADRGRLNISLPAALAADAAGEVQLYRPNQSAADRRFPLKSSAEGQPAAIPAGDLAPGLWKVRLQWNSGGREYFAERSVVVPAPPNR